MSIQNQCLGVYSWNLTCNVFCHVGQSMSCRLRWRLYHAECNPALWTGPQASTANYSYTLDFKAGIKMEGWWLWGLVVVSGGLLG